MSEPITQRVQGRIKYIEEKLKYDNSPELQRRLKNYKDFKSILSLFTFRDIKYFSDEYKEHLVRLFCASYECFNDCPFTNCELSSLSLDERLKMILLNK